MHPAPSLIAFTTLSGLGFGLMAWLGAGFGPPGGTAGLALAAAALGLAGAGLLASLAHLGNPQRAWRALSQWRSSWLSREGVLAIATLAAFLVHAALWLLGGMRLPLLGGLAALLALGTVTCTAMIYAQLRTVPRWHTPLTPALFLLSALAAPALLAGQPLAALLLLPVLGGVQMLHWRLGDGALAARGHGTGTATGLGPAGTVRPFEPPHTGPNYVTREMVFAVGRRRSAALRRLALGLGIALPAALLALRPALPAAWPADALALLSHLAGTLAGRWLFFAEAEHVVGLYYPKSSATGRPAPPVPAPRDRGPA